MFCCSTGNASNSARLIIVSYIFEISTFDAFGSYVSLFLSACQLEITSFRHILVFLFYDERPKQFAFSRISSCSTRCTSIFLPSPLFLVYLPIRNDPMKRIPVHSYRNELESYYTSIMSLLSYHILLPIEKETNIPTIQTRFPFLPSVTSFFVLLLSFYLQTHFLISYTICLFTGKVRFTSPYGIQIPRACIRSITLSTIYSSS